MFESIKRFFSKPAAGRNLREVFEWAQRGGHEVRRAKGDEGFVIDGAFQGKPWRLEWGPAQRAYIEGHELRIRMELHLPQDQQMMLLSRHLMDALERQTYEQFIDNVQTRIDAHTPEEVRWLVMFPKVSLSGLSAFSARFDAVASQPEVGRSWIEGPLARLLEREAQQGLLLEDPPFVLMTLRGRAYMRLQMTAPAAADIASALALFETAVAQAMRVTPAVADTAAAWSATASTSWQSLQPDDEVDPRKRR